MGKFMVLRPPATSASPKRITVGIFPATAKPGLRQEALRALSSSLSRIGHCVEWVGGKRYERCDLAVVYGYPGVGGSGCRHAVRQSIIGVHKGPILIVETPLFGRKVPALERSILPFLIRRPDESFDRFRVSLNGCFWDDGIFCNGEIDPGRWNSLQRELGLEVRDYRKQGSHILLAGQVPGDASLRGKDIIGWIEEVAREVSAISDRPIRIRPHPRSDHNALKSVMRRLKVFPRVSWDIEPGSSFRAALADAWVTVTYSSGAAIDSLLMGVPALSMCPASMAWSVTDHDLQKVNSPTLFERRPWLDQLAHAQWTIPEIEDGTVWKRFEAHALALVATATAETSGTR